MHIENTNDLAQWYVIYTHAKQEERAYLNLVSGGVEVFCPRLKDRQKKSYSVASGYVTKHLFPRYIFARFNVNTMLHRINFTRGVHSVVSFGGVPPPLDSRMIEIMKSQIHEDGFIRIEDDLSSGDRVVINNGPFKNFTGIFERQMKDSERVRILLSTINYQGCIEIERELVEKSSAKVAC